MHVRDDLQVLRVLLASRVLLLKHLARTRVEGHRVQIHHAKGLLINGGRDEAHLGRSLCKRAAHSATTLDDERLGRIDAEPLGHHAAAHATRASADD